jgi:hypothetical protein
MPTAAGGYWQSTDEHDKTANNELINNSSTAAQEPELHLLYNTNYSLRPLKHAIFVFREVKQF